MGVQECYHSAHSKVPFNKMCLGPLEAAWSCVGHAQISILIGQCIYTLPPLSSLVSLFFIDTFFLLCMVLLSVSHVASFCGLAGAYTIILLLLLSGFFNYYLWPAHH